MTIESEIARLNTTNTALTQEVVGIKDRIDAQEQNVNDDAQSALEHKNAAQAAETGAGNHEAQAKVEADRAKSEADNAASVVTGGTATLDSEAGKIPLADSDGKIDLSWLPAEAQGYNVFAQEQAVNNDKFAASGFVHMGKHLVSGTTYTPINQGLWADPTTPNVLNIGRTEGSGDSKEDYPSTVIAGVCNKLSHINHSDERTRIKFPDAPNGTVTYDSATGVITDYTKDVDPKYGDVAPDVNEAVARAFEGDIKNGDFRFGDDGSWTDQSIGFMAIADGSATCTDAPTNTSMTQSRTYTANTYLVMVSGVFTLGETFWITLYNGEDGNVYHAFTGTGANQTVYATLSVTANSQLFIQNRSGVTLSYEVSNTSVRKVTNEVVTERVDMWGFEGWLEEVSQANPYVYQNGLIQSQATDIDGVSTGSSNRPDTYYAVFDGDTTSRGNGVNFWSITDAQRKAIFSNPDNKLYLIDGKIYQWRLRQRTIAGVGNGDWSGIDSTKVDGLNILRHNTGANNGRVGVQGSKDIPQNVSGGGWFYAGYGNPSYGANKSLGTYSSLEDDGSDSGAAYFLVCGTVSRLNQGAYHPSFNPSGARKLRVEYNNGGSYNYSVSWDEDFTSERPRSQKQLFEVISTGGVAGEAKASSTSGYIGGPSGSGRPDGRFYDAIYADGLGGVVLDMRYSAWDKSAPEHKAKALAMVENGTYRGVEKLVETKAYSGVSDIIARANSNFTLGTGEVFPELELGPAPYYPTKCSLIDSAGGVLTGVDYLYYNGTSTYIYFKDDISCSAGIAYLVLSEEKNHSVGGEFQLTEVIGDPANILANPDLKEGWLGVWNPTIPDGVNLKFPFSRKVVSSSLLSTISSSDNGSSWNSLSVTYNAVTNDKDVAWGADSTTVYDYTAFAKQTKPSTNQPVFNGEAGIGNVRVSNSSVVGRGVLISESLSGLVMTDGAYASIKYTPTRVTFDDETGKLGTSWGTEHLVQHDVIRGLNSITGSAVKFLTTQINVNNQASIQLSYEELKYDGDWGDNNGIAAHYSGDSTNTDTNGNTVKCGVHELAIPYGWIKNET